MQAELDGFAHKLMMALDNCDEPDEVEAEYDTWDVGATWEGYPGMVERCIEIKLSRLAEISTLNAG